MRYALVEDVAGARVPAQVWQPNGTSQPSETRVEQWLDAESRWVDAALAHRYTVPITDADDRETLREIVADLVAGRVWDVLSAHQGESNGMASSFRKNALRMLGYSDRTGRASLVLPNSAAADADEAGLGIKTGTLMISDPSP